MNILYLNNSMHLGGDNKCILKLCKELKENNKICIASNGGILEDEFTNLGIKHYQIKNVVDKRPSVIISNIKSLIKIIKNEQIDIIHSHHRMSTMTAKIVSKFTGTKVIHTQHLCIEDKFKLTKMALNNIRTIAVSESAKRILIEKSGLSEKDITTIYNAIETETENKKVDSKLVELKNKGYFIVAQVSRIIDYKGIYDFVNVSKETVKKNDNIRFVLIGDGPEFNNLKKILVKENLEEYVYMLGRKDNVIEHLKYIDLLILCSYIEGLPLGPIEAFSQGVPVIATNIDGTNEEIINDYNGYLVEKKDIQGFVDNIQKIYDNDTLRYNLSENAKKDYAERFTTEKYVNMHKEVYLEQ